MNEDELEVNNELKFLKLSDDNFKDRHDISLPKWVEEIDPIESFYNESNKKCKNKDSDEDINIEGDGDLQIEEIMAERNENDKDMKAALKKFFKKESK